MSNKEIFTVIGKVKLVDNSKKFIPNSPDHMKACISRLSIGHTLSCTFSENVASRSQAQLAYHWVLIGYLASETGHSEQETHEAVMILKFGTKPLKIGNRTVQVRSSISDKAHMPKYKAIELIEEDLRLCAELGIVVPSAESLGYISNH